MSIEQKSLKQIIDHRIDKLSKLRKKGINPYPSEFKPTHFSESIKSNYKKMEGKNVVIAGRIMSLRKMGKASFFRIYDKEGGIQIFIKKDDIGYESYENFKLLDIVDFVGIQGMVFTTKTGEISIKTSIITVLAKSIRPLPIVKEKDGTIYDAFSDKEQRYRNRHLDLLLNPNVKNTFLKRTKIIRSIRNFLDNLQFLEVETPVLQPIYGGANARPFITHHNTLDRTLYMRIADELYLKRLIIGGIDKVYEIGKDFRNEGMDRNHNPEFTMLEFYWAYADYEDCMNLVEGLIKYAAKDIGSLKIFLNDIEIDLNKPFKKRRFSELLSEKLDLDFNDCMELVEEIIRNAAKKIGDLKIKWGEYDIDLSKKFDKKSFFQLIEEATDTNFSRLSNNEMLEVCKLNNIEVDKNSNTGQILDSIMSELVEPKLINPTFVIDYPKSISPLAKLKRDGSEEIVERFELFIGGSEFANSFSELNDPIDQRSRLEEQSKLRDQGDDEAQPIDDDFIKAMEIGMPPTGGVGIGIDRLVMLLTNNRWIRDVILFPTMKPEKN